VFSDENITLNSNYGTTCKQPISAQADPGAEIAFIHCRSVAALPYCTRAADGMRVLKLRGETSMKSERESGKIGYILAWAMGVPVSLLFIVFLLRGCT